MFVVHFKGRGEGCDYTIACNQKTLVAPEDIDTIEEAEQWAIDGDDKTHYGINEEQYAAVTIYQVANFKKVDVESVFAERRRMEKERKQQEEEDKARKQFEQLKKRFEGSTSS